MFLTNSGGKSNAPISPGTEGTTGTVSSNAQSSSGASGGESEGGASRSTPNLWLAGFLVFVLNISRIYVIVCFQSRLEILAILVTHINDCV